MTDILVLVQFFVKPLKNIGKENFLNEHIFFAFSFDDMIWAEKHIVDPIFVNRKDTYNLSLGGMGGFDSIPLKPVKKCLSPRLVNLNQKKPL